MSWNRAMLGEMVTLRRGFDLPGTKRVRGNVPVVSSAGVTGFHNTARCVGPGVVTGRYGTLGQVYFLKRDFWPLNTALYVSDFKGYDPRFVAYALKYALRTLPGDKTSLPGVSRHDLHRVPVAIPDATTQARVSSFLGAYDDLIEANERRISLLAEAADHLYVQVLSRSAAKSKHRNSGPGLPEAIWDQMPVGDLCLSMEEGHWIKGDRGGGADYFIAQTSNLAVGQLADGAHWATLDEKAAVRLKCRTVVREQILVACLPRPVGRVWLVADLALPLLAASGVMTLTLNDELVDPFFLAHQMNRPLHLSRCERMAQGAPRHRLSKANLSRIPVIVPPLQVQRLFRDRTEHYANLRATLQKQNQKLAQTRDILLPKLFSDGDQILTGP